MERIEAGRIERPAKMVFEDINAEALRVHDANKKWWIDIHTEVPLKRNILELGMLTSSELAEALEGHRKNKMDDHLPQYPMAVVELADCVIRVLDSMGGLGYSFSEKEYKNWRLSGWITNSNNFGEVLFTINREVVRLYDYFNYEAGNVRHHFDPLSLEARASIVVGMCELAARVFFPSVWFREVYEAKMAYNASRKDHTLEHRRSAEGKKY